MCKGVHHLLYADDLSMFVIEDNLDDANRKLSLAINETKKLLNKEGFTFSAEKSVFMLFIRKE